MKIIDPKTHNQVYWVGAVVLAFNPVPPPGWVFISLIGWMFIWLLVVPILADLFCGRG